MQPVNVRDEIKLKLSILPESPGVYRYYDKNGVIIYVGKAKNLKRRVNSYFNRVHPVLRTSMLVRHIWDLQYDIVNSEEEALDLENSLIKEYKPHYNVLLKDDKSYPWICVTKELFPRVYLTREKPDKGGKYFGPYPKVEVAKALIDVLRQIYPIRSCRHHLTPLVVSTKKVRLCLQYHIKRCPGCCQDFILPESYGKYIDEVKQILNGDTKQVSDYLVEEMTRLASLLKFEEAEVLKRKYLLIEQYRSKSVIVSPAIHNIDVFSLIREEGFAYFNYLHVRGGSIVHTLTLEYKIVDTDSDETDQELMTTAIREIHDRFKETYERDRVKEAVVNIRPDFNMYDTVFSIPQRGDKRKLLDISLKNAEQYKIDKYKKMEKLNPEQRAMRTLTTIQRDLHLRSVPHHIECFDNSNTGGTGAVASCVVFRDGKPSKKDYRHFNIKTVEGPDDYASMREVLARRYSRLVAEGQDLPQLIVVDGGKGQLSTAVGVLDELGLRNRVAAVGIAKRMNEIYFPGDSVPLFIDPKSETLHVIQLLRDEAHRFAITHHRKKRGKSQIASELDFIQGIGEKTKELLIRHFKSLKRVKEASLDDLEEVLGKHKARLLHSALHSHDNNMQIIETK